MSHTSDAPVDAQERKIRQLESENASLRGAAQGLGELCDRYKAENERLEKRLVQYGLFNEVVGDPAHEFASLRRRLHNIERENAKLRNLMQKSIDEQFEACGSWDNHCDMCDCSCFVSENRDELRTLGFGVDQWTE